MSPCPGRMSSHQSGRFPAGGPVRSPARLLAAAAVLVLFGIVGACTPAPGGETASPGAPLTSAPATSPSAAVSDTPPPTSSAAGLTIEIMIAKGQVTPNAEKIDIAKGTTVTLEVTSDSDDEIHVHTAGDGYELEVKAGEPATGSVVAADTGSFEIESHELDKVIAILNVR